ncbi:atpase oscp/delta subunit [Trichococcus pasteurii]|uniref:ATP synthase subunit delta n=2 Tax=Trichococcus pasteurii TaxID=43064 RepID=A0A1W1IFG2_9LACT|nr:ATP synthase delta (OSCP) subunit [Trichococcus pasteurii]SLM51756.1 atpase oscp/delta subunit [Trichococcus pasteurii]SSB92637.1 atpase oscp/delta subunit [Trichococcus pasteurii]
MVKDGKAITTVEAYVQAYYNRLTDSKTADRLYLDLSQLKDAFNHADAAEGEKPNLDLAVKYLAPETLLFLEGLQDNLDNEGILASVKAFNELYENKKVFVNVKLTSAVPLTAEQKTRIMDKMEKRIGEATFFVKEVVDPSVMGGVRLESENHYFDNTIATKLKEMKRHILKD